MTRSLLLGTFLLAALGLPCRADETPPKQSFPLAGTITFGTSYALAFGFAIRFDEPELLIPVLGPIIDLHRCRDCTASGAEKAVIAGFILDSAAQAAGVALIVHELRRKPQPRRGEILPALVAGSPGVTLSGWF
jgi:hypothetical protein